MTEVKELAKLDAMTASKPENYCEAEEPPGPKGECCIAGLCGSQPTAKKLLTNMENHPDKKKEIPKKSLIGLKGGKWDIDTCSPNAFPFQTHHLIPKKHLPKHAVCTWLAVKEGENADPDYQIDKDNVYNTDAAENGYCMPFVSTTYQWAKANGDEALQDEAAFALMDKTHIQLHQGAHSYEEFGEEEEEDEPDMETTTGYLGAVNVLLGRIHRSARKHVSGCVACNKKGKKKPKNVVPVESVVTHMHQASLILKLKINNNKIFVSRKAWEWHEKKKKRKK